MSTLKSAPVFVTVLATTKIISGASQISILASGGDVSISSGATNVIILPDGKSLEFSSGTEGLSDITITTLAGITALVVWNN